MTTGRHRRDDAPTCRTLLHDAFDSCEEELDEPQSDRDMFAADWATVHIMVDTDCAEARQGIPNDDAHLHFGKGQLEAELELASGAHTLCLQAADGLHVALPGDGMSHTIALVVE